MWKQAVAKSKPIKVSLKDVIIDSILDKKGEDVVSLDLSSLPDAITDYFIICDATSRVQVKAIADHLIEKVKKETGEIPWQKEGFTNSEWILVDYVDIVIHIFLKETRDFYQLEDLWSDAVVTKHE